MTKTQYYVAASLDGYIADADGRLGWLTQFDRVEGVGARYQAFLSGVGALAMGAATYEFLLREGGDTWPYQGLPTWVFTHRKLAVFPGDADIRFVAGDDLPGLHATMCDAARGKNLWLVGGGNLVAQFVRQRLLDELILSLVPVALGSGAQLLPAPVPALRLLGLIQLGGGLVELHYQLERDAA